MLKIKDNVDLKELEIFLTIKTIFKILFSKRFWKCVKDGIINIPNILANKINNTTKELNTIIDKRKR